MSANKLDDIESVKENMVADPGPRDELSEQRSQIEVMLSLPARTSLQTAELRKLVEDMRARIPPEREAEFGRFFRGVDEQLSENAPRGGDAGTPSPLDVSTPLQGNVSDPGGRQP